MALTIRPTSKWWYGKFRDGDEKFSVINLNVEIKGCRPPTLHEQGDAQFEATRLAAEEKFREMLETRQHKKAGIKYAEAVLEMASGKKSHSPLLSELADTWAIDHHIEVVKDGDETRFEGASESHITHSQGALNKFGGFMGLKHSTVMDMAGVKDQHVKAFLRSITSEKLSSRTWNYYLVLLREMFNRHEPTSSAAEYLRLVVEKDEETVHRRPFTDDQLLAILAEAKKDPFVRPIIVAGINTPLRLGDCCKLGWKAVDAENRFLTFKNSKTGEEVSIPVWDELKEELDARPRDGKFVFPEHAAMYAANPTGINSRLLAIFSRAGIKFYSEVAPAPKSKQKKTKLGKADEKQTKDVETDGNEIRNKQTAPGPRRVNESGFQAFRVTWVTRAMLRGVNDEILRKATGHTTVDIVRKHYFQPAKEAMRTELEKAKPSFAKGAIAPAEEKIISILKAMTSKNWKKGRNTILELLNKQVPQLQNSK